MNAPAKVSVTAGAPLLRVGDHTAPRPPLHPGLPLIGSLVPMIRAPVELFLDCYRTHGPISRIRVAGRELTVLVGTEAMQLLAREERRLFAMKPIYGEFEALFGAEHSLIGADGDLHTDLRKRFKPSMSRTRMEACLPVAIDVVRERLARRRPGEIVPLVDFCRDIVFSQLGEVMSGHRADEYFDDITRVLHTALEVAIIQRLPRFFAHDPRFVRARARLMALSDRLLASIPDDDSPRSANILVALRRAMKDGVLSEKDAPLLTLTPYFAGLDTVATSLAFFVYAVYRDAALRARVREEANLAFLAGDPGPDWLDRLAFTDACRKEAMRRYPVTIGSIRRTATPFVFAGHRVEAGEDALFAISAQLFMPEHYPNPYRFAPERFLDGAPTPASGAFTPFGVGAHTCLGAGLAEAQLTATIATLLRDDRIELVAPPREVRVRYAPLPEPVGLRVKIR